MKSILDPSFRYTPSVATDIRKTFVRARRELRKREGAGTGLDTGATARVLRIDRRLQQR